MVDDQLREPCYGAMPTARGGGGAGGAPPAPPPPRPRPRPPPPRGGDDAAAAVAARLRSSGDSDDELKKRRRDELKLLQANDLLSAGCLLAEVGRPVFAMRVWHIRIDLVVSEITTR